MKDNLIYIKHILESIKNIEEFTKGINKEKFSNDNLRQNAVIRQLEIIGEASKNLSEEFKNKYKFVEWKLIAGFRDKLIHHYFGVELERVWNVIEKDLPDLKKKIEKIKLNEM
ncbi:MAG: DUF86 domain-containing protein [Nanoarchaeota archaeon]|nr:DUF86 domain-containing protein [Nanoarchaeota archaeon]